MGLVTTAIAALFIGLGVAAGRLLASRAFGIRGFRRATSTEEERGRPALAFARAGASIAGIYLASVVLMGCALSGGRPTVDDVSMRMTVIKGGPAAASLAQSASRQRRRRPRRTVCRPT